MSFINDPDYFDQHFLLDNDVISKFIEISHLNKNDVVVEVGPGKGVITNLIAKKVKKLYCIELDLRLKPYLDQICIKNPNLEVIYSSVLDIDIPKCNKIITSLPYSIIEPFMNKMIKTNFDELIMIMGSKFANGVENKIINKLSLLTNCFFEFEKIMDIDAECFYPAPRTMSTMLILKHKKNEQNDIYAFFRNMYLLNHKKIKNSVIESLIVTGHTKTQRESREILKSMCIPEEILETKFETCSNEQLEILYSEISKIYNK